MRILKIILFTSFLVLLSANASQSTYNKQDMIKYAEWLDGYYNVDKKIILAYIQTESNFEPFAMLIKTKNPKKLKNTLKYFGFNGKGSGKYISVVPKSKGKAMYLYDLITNNFEELEIEDYDFGLMQINTRTAKRFKVESERDLYLNWKDNMRLGTEVIRGCYNMLKDKLEIASIIECYNRGTNIRWLEQSNSDYLKRFMKNYNLQY